MLLHLLRDRTWGLVRYLALQIVTFMNFKCLQIQKEEVHYFGNIFKFIMHKYKFYSSMPSFYKAAFIPCISGCGLSLLFLEDRSLSSIAELNMCSILLCCLCSRGQACIQKGIQQPQTQHWTVSDLEAAVQQTFILLSLISLFHSEEQPLKPNARLSHWIKPQGPALLTKPMRISLP